MDNSQIIVTACIVVIFVCLGVIYSIVRNLIRRVADNQNVWLSYETDKVKSELRQSGNPNLPKMKNPPEPPPHTKAAVPGEFTGDEVARMLQNFASVNIENINKMRPGTVESDISEADKLTIERHFDSMRDELLRNFENEISNNDQRKIPSVNIEKCKKSIHSKNNWKIDVSQYVKKWVGPLEYQKGGGCFVATEWDYCILSNDFKPFLESKTITDAAAAVGNYGQNDLPNVTNWKSDKA